MEKQLQVIRTYFIAFFNELEKRAHEFVLRPGKDFIRHRKLTFVETLKTITIMEGNSLDKEL